ncbi:MAG: pilus assembly protein N-terminal domain-containing protein [Bacillota bacterium]|nr:pilus assembly protein N-terminal domain-containing protein [Bacillota bacterium]
MSSGIRWPADWRRSIADACLLTLILGLSLFLVAGGAARGAEPPEVIVVRTGESRVITVPEVSRVAVGQPAVADVRVISPGEILVNGKSEGQTTLLLWPSSGRVIEQQVRVLCPSPVLSERDIEDLVADEGIRVRSVGGYVVVDGRPAAEGRLRLERLAALLGSKLLDLTGSVDEREEDSGTPVSRPRQQDLEWVTALVQRNSGGGVVLTRQAGRIVLEGQVPSEAARQTAIRLAEAFFPGQVVDALAAVEPSGLFSIKARLIEVDRQACRELGLEWPAEAGVGERSLPGGMHLEPLARLEPLLVKLKALEDSGRARILAEPSMTVMDGAAGCFLAGGQIPVPLEVDGQATVEWKEYGVRLDVRPALLPSGRIRLTVRPEVSTLDWANGVRLGAGTVPALRSRWAETAVEQESGDTLILAGLSLAEETDHGGRVPALANVPLLGGLFRADRAARRQTELTILLTTTLVSPCPTAGEKPEGGGE